MDSLAAAALYPSGNTLLRKRKRTDHGASAERHPDTDGHVFGNFKNYYEFNPTVERMKFLSAKVLRLLFERISGTLRCLDIGCNTGDLTLGLYHALVSCKPAADVRVTGIDLDESLVESAMQNARRSNASDNCSFKCADIMSALPSGNAWLPKDGIFDLVTVFGLTMWIHLHHGDAGLQAFLRKVSKLTSSFLIIETHPWKCYKKARKRLRQRQRHMNECDWKDFPEWKSICYRGESVVKFIHDELTSSKCGLVFKEDIGMTVWGRGIKLYQKSSKKV